MVRVIDLEDFPTEEFVASLDDHCHRVLWAVGMNGLMDVFESGSRSRSIHEHVLAGGNRVDLKVLADEAVDLLAFGAEDDCEELGVVLPED
jgi:hypothetical protein